MSYPNRRGGGEGIPGPAGANGVGIASSTIGYQVSSSPTTPPTEWHSSPPEVPKGSYLWTKVGMNYTNNTSSTAYAVAYVGSDGEPGAAGKDGANGKDGKGIASSVVEYQLSSSGSSPPSGAWSTTLPSANKGQYLWVRTTINYSDSTSTSAYSVSYLGADGVPGKDGSPGQAGQPGKDGVNGTNGVGVSSSAVTYQISASGASVPAGTWSSTLPSLVKGQYLWSRAVISYTDGSSTTVYSVSYQGADGSPGQKGDTGATGSTGPANTLTIGTVGTGEAAATITGTSPNQVLNLTLPPGNNGVTPTFAVGTVSTLLPGSSATVSVSGTAPNYVLNFGLPAGLTGSAPVLGIGSVTTLAAGSAATATISGTAPNYLLNIGIPAGAAGASGVSYSPQAPVARTVTAATAYQHTDTTKPCKVTVNARATQTVTVAGTVADRLELRIGPTAAAVAPSGAGGFSMGVWESGITGIALMIGAAVQDGGQITADLPAGWYFQINRLSGTSATVVSCFTQSLTA